MKQQKLKDMKITKEVVYGNSEFALDLYQQVKEMKGNLFFSPYSISMALSMVYAGARGNTKTQMAQTLHFPPDHAKWIGLS